jgi:hypothetical protein
MVNRPPTARDVDEPLLAQLRQYAMPILVCVTLAFIGAQIVVAVVIAVGFRVMERMGGNWPNAKDLLKAFQLALILLGPLVATGIAVVIGTMAGIRWGRRQATEGTIPGGAPRRESGRPKGGCPSHGAGERDGGRREGSS